jgi:hypothetical protein
MYYLKNSILTLSIGSYTKGLKNLLLVFFLLCSYGVSAQGSPQGRRPVSGSTARISAKDTVKLQLADSLISKESGLSTTVKRYAKDSVIFNVRKKLYHLYNEAKVEYLPTKLGADYIMLDWGSNEIYARGVVDPEDSLGVRIKGKPVFEDGTETYHVDSMRYNFKSKRAKIYSVATEQGEGYIHGKIVKKDQYDNLHLGFAKYTTCNLAEPHFHISAKKIMFINKKSALSGPFNLVVHNIPLPIGFLFGFFPVQPKQDIGTSGFVMGSYGEQRNDGRGFYFNDFGYYHAFNERLSNTVTFQVYSNLSFGIKEQVDYSKKYKYNGMFALQFNRNVQSNQYGLRGKDYNPANHQFNVQWSHTPRSLRTDRSFSSNMNYMTNGFQASNVRSSNISTVMQNNVGGSINYMRNFGKLYTSTYSFSVSQNQNDFRSSLGYSMGLKQFNPFVKPKNQTGEWYESFRVGLNLTGAVQTSNSIVNRSSSYTDYNIAGVQNSPYTEAQQRRINELNLLIYDLTLSLEARDAYRKELESLQNPRLQGLGPILQNSIITNSYTVPITLPNVKIAKYINLTPSISLRGDLYDRSLKYNFVNESQELTLSSGRKVFVNVDDAIDTLSYRRDAEGLHVDMNSRSGGVVVIDTVKGLNFANQVSFGASMNTRLYGTFNLGTKGRIQALRHTLNPSVGFSYTPQNRNSVYQQVRSDSSYRYLPRYIGGSGSSSRDAGNISFSLSNQLEAKVRSRSDSSESDLEKVMLLDNFNISTSYNIFARKELNEFALSPVALSTNTSLFKRKLNINASAVLDPYMYVKDPVVASNLAGIRVTRFKWQKKNSEYRDEDVGSYLSSMNFGASTSLNPKVFKGERSAAATPALNPYANVPLNPMDYVDFEIPWNLNLNYAANYIKQGLSPERWTMSFSFSGDVSMTKNTKITFNSGWDFRFKQITLTTVGVVRELHCWTFSLNWTPISGSAMRSGGFDFTLRPKANLLKDLKVTRRRAGSF